MKKDLTITAESRDTRGKNEARRLRASGMAPAVIYGAGTDPIAVAINPKEISGILRSTSGHNTIFNVDVGGQLAPVMIVDWQNDPIKGKLLHIDLKRIDMNQRMTVKVGVHTTGEPKGVKIQGGLHEVITREVEVECLPSDIPESFTLNVAELMIGQNLRASDIPLPEGMRLITAPDTVISHVVSLRTSAATEAEPGAAAPAAPEPEVIKKGKKEEEGAEKKDDKKKK